MLPSIAFADARNGELFGYKIGDVYPVTDSTMGHPHWIRNLITIYPENPKKPKDIGNVVMGVTLKSFTIVFIYSETEFDSYKKAKSCAYKYEALLIAKYNIDTPWDSINRQSSKPNKVGLTPGDSIFYDFSFLDLNDDYEINFMVADSDDKGFLVHIGLKTKNSLAEKLSKIEEKEYNEVLVEEAEKKNLLEGF